MKWVGGWGGRYARVVGWVGGETGMPESYDGVRAMMEWVGGWGAGMPENYGEESAMFLASGSLWTKQSISVVWNVKEKRALTLESIHAHCEGAHPLTQGVEWADQEHESSLETRQD